MSCPHCQIELPENYAAGSCPSCGHTLLTPAESKAPESPARNKATYWLVFWLAFFGSPILGLLAGAARVREGILLLPFLGAMIAGFALAKVFTKTTAAYIATGILFTIGVLAIYLGIIFVGCLVIVGHNGGI